MTKALLTDLQWRGLVNQTSDINALGAHLDSGPRTLYCGFDPTAESLHIGSLVPLLALRRFQLAGHTPIALIGGATGLIGDPSFRGNERSLNDSELVEFWVTRLHAQVAHFIDLEAGARLENNLDWTHELDVISFLRDAGKHFSVNEMIRKEAVRQRLEREDSGISFTEFSYMLLQAMDYEHLARRHDCTLQIGGSDQWGNITAGIQLVRRRLGRGAYALTLPLVTQADGRKFGKTGQGTIWLDGKLTSPYSFHQFWLNTADADVGTYLRYFTFLECREIEALDAEIKTAPEKRRAQHRLADEVTALVHGEDGLRSAQRIAEGLFRGDLGALKADDLAQLALDGLPTCRAEEEFLKVGQALVALGLAESNSAAMRFMSSGAVSINGETVVDVAAEIRSFPCLAGGYRILRRGKRNWGLVMPAL